MAGKGSRRRPALVDDKVIEENWKRVFGDKRCWCPRFLPYPEPDQTYPAWQLAEGQKIPEPEEKP